MKVITNNQTNSILFIKSNEDISDLSIARLRQLGSAGYYDIPIDSYTSDCFTCTVEIALPLNALPNATYLLQLLDSLSNIIITKSISVDGHDNNDSRGYIIVDDNVDSELVIKQPDEQISWANTGLSWSNT